jgi:hypothetical protein
MVPMAPVAGYGTPFVPFAGGGGMSFSMSMQGDMSLALPLLGRLASAVFSPNIEPIRNDLLSFLAGRIPGDAMTKADALKLLEELDKRLEKRFQNMEDLVKSSAAKPADGTKPTGKDAKDTSPKPTGTYRSPEIEKARTELQAMLDQGSASSPSTKANEIKQARAELQAMLNQPPASQAVAGARKLNHGQGASASAARAR